MGSGATLIACEKMDRIAYGLEIDPFFVQTIIARYNYYTNGEKPIECINNPALDIKSIINAHKEK